MPWCTKGTPPLAKPGKSMLIFGCVISPATSRWLFAELASCVAVRCLPHLQVEVEMGKKIGGKKLDEPHSLKSNEMAQCSFKPQQPLVCDTFRKCKGLSRVAFSAGAAALEQSLTDAFSGKKKAPEKLGDLLTPLFWKEGWRIPSWT